MFCLWIMAVAVFIYFFFYYFYFYFYFLFTSLLTPRVIQNHITRVFICKVSFKLEKKLVLFHFLIFLAVLYIIECLFWFDMHLVHDCFVSTILHFTAAVSSLNLTLIPTAYYFHIETQNHTCCKRNCTLLYFYISEELMTSQEVTYPSEKQGFTPKNKTKKR